MRFEKKIEIVNIFRIQVKMSTFVQFQLKIDENNLNVNKKLTFLGGAKVLFKKIEFEQKVRVLWLNFMPILKTVKTCSLNIE